MNWVQRKIYLYNVTFGLYMLDWWERFLFNTLVIVLMWFVCYNGVRFASEVCRRGMFNGFWTVFTREVYFFGKYQEISLQEGKNTSCYSDMLPSAGPSNHQRT